MIVRKMSLTLRLAEHYYFVVDSFVYRTIILYSRRRAVKQMASSIDMPI